jgi:hypothetical protein
MEQAAPRVEVEGDRNRRLAAAGLEGGGFGQAGGQQLEPAAPDTEGLALVLNPALEGLAEADALTHRRGVHPKAPTLLPRLQGKSRQSRRFGAAPGGEQQGRQGAEILAGWLGRPRCGARRGRPVVQSVLGQQQIEVRRLATLHREAASHMPLGGELGHGEPVDPHLDDGVGRRFQIGGVACRQLHGGEQAIVKGHRQQASVLPLELRQQAGGASLQDALHPSFG